MTLKKRILAEGFFHLTIKGGYVRDIFIPEMIVREFKLEHGDWCKVYGVPNKLSIEIGLPPSNKNPIRPTKFIDIEKCVVEQDESGVLFTTRTEIGDNLADLIGIDAIIGLQDVPKLDIHNGDLIDIRYSYLDSQPRPHVVWVHRKQKLTRLNDSKD